MNEIRFKVFRFVITRFGKFRKVWVLTQAFDAGLAGLTLVTAPSVSHCISSIKHEISSWPNVATARHPLGGTQFNWRGTELGHIHSNGVADVALNAPEKADVLSKGLAQPHHVAPKSTWVSFFIVRADQEEGVLSLFRVPYRRLTSPDAADSESPSEEYAQ